MISWQPCCCPLRVERFGMPSGGGGWMTAVQATVSEDIPLPAPPPAPACRTFSREVNQPQLSLSQPPFHLDPQLWTRPLLPGRASAARLTGPDPGMNPASRSELPRLPQALLFHGSLEAFEGADTEGRKLLPAPPHPLTLPRVHLSLFLDLKKKLRY